MYKIKLENTLTHQQYQYQCEDLNNGEKLYFKFNIDTKDLEDGEYLLTLLDKRDKVVAEDVLKIGDFNPSTLQYKSGDNTYIAISFDAKLGAKNAVISSVESAVYPDDGYDGMTVVNVNAQGVYDSGYDVGNLEGYNSGYTNGYNEGNTDGYNEGKTDGYNDGYSEGKDDGIVEGTSNAKENILENAQVLDITENGTYTDTDKLIKEVNVNVIPKINMQETGLKLAHSTFTDIPEWADWSGITDMSYMFRDANITTIPKIDTSRVTNMQYMFYGCTKLTTIPQLNTSKVTTMYYMFNYCSSLTTIPQLDTSRVTNMQNMFYNCTKLVSLPLLDFSSVTNIYYFFGTSYIRNLRDLGGFKNLKINWDDSYGLNNLPNLTYDSVMNIINNLYDFRTNGNTSTTRTIKFNPNSKALLSESDIAIATAKGWIIS